MRHTQLRSFHAVAQRASFTQAARALGVGQPTITTQVRSLEQEFGVELFVRRGRRIELTEAGSGLLDITRRLFADEKEAADYLNETRGLRTGHLRVGAVGPYHVTDMLAAFNARHPGLYVSVAVGNSRDTVRDLLDYRTDVAVLAHVDPDPRLVAIPYRRHRVIVFCPADHPFGKRRFIRAHEMEGQRLIVREAGSTTRRAFDQAMRDADVRPRVVMEIGSRESIREAVAKGIGLGVVSEAEFIPDPRIRPVPVGDAEIYTYAHVVYLKERQNARLVRAFLEVLSGLLPDAPVNGVSSPSSRRRPSNSRR
ncbi:MAG: LysR family transcriptional regulator [Reyranella sp.]|uniref:LysR substrate-binding domain-containing protein n=1 Tax=Reyranella sp. TaxID=1929291 RepID=UPI001AD5BE07|nr:LysR substrate-binding domain-containing protein [Reyranella sp.]MBN9085826.1 LysR family transcriptional regulator [Reyranella sp.]